MRTLSLIAISIPTPSKLPRTSSSKAVVSFGGKKIVYGSPYDAVRPSIAPYTFSLSVGTDEEAVVATNRSFNVSKVFQKGARSKISDDVATGVFGASVTADFSNPDCTPRLYAPTSPITEIAIMNGLLTLVFIPLEVGNAMRFRSWLLFIKKFDHFTIKIPVGVV